MTGQEFHDDIAYGHNVGEIAQQMRQMTNDYFREPDS